MLNQRESRARSRISSPWVSPSSLPQLLYSPPQVIKSLQVLKLDMSEFLKIHHGHVKSAVSFGFGWYLSPLSTFKKSPNLRTCIAIRLLASADNFFCSFLSAREGTIRSINTQCRANTARKQGWRTHSDKEGASTK